MPIYDLQLPNTAIHPDHTGQLDRARDACLARQRRVHRLYAPDDARHLDDTGLYPYRWFGLRRLDRLSDLRFLRARRRRHPRRWIEYAADQAGKIADADATVDTWSRIRRVLDDRHLIRNDKGLSEPFSDHLPRRVDRP